MRTLQSALDNLIGAQKRIDVRAHLRPLGPSDRP